MLFQIPNTSGRKGGDRVPASQLVASRLIAGGLSAKATLFEATKPFFVA